MSKSDEAQAALRKHVGNFQFVSVSIGGVSCIAVVDRGEPAMVSVIGAGDDGDVVALRRYVPHAGERTASEILELALKDDGGGRDELMFSEILEYFGGRGGTSTFSERFAESFQIANAALGLRRGGLVDTADAFLRSSGVPAMLARLDNDAIRALECISTFGKGAYAFYASPDRGVIRRQAADRFPLLAGEIAARVRVKMAVDRKVSYDDVLMSAFGADRFGNPKLTRPLLKRLTGKRYLDGGVEIESLVDFLSQVPVEWFPANETEWNSFVDISATFLRRLAPDFGGDISGLVAGVAGRWTEFAERVAKAYAPTLPPDELTDDEKATWTPPVDTSRDAMSGAAESTKDVILAFRNLIVLPAAAQAGASHDAIIGNDQRRLGSDVAAALLFGGKTLMPIMEVQRHWHTQAPNILAAIPEREIRRGDVKEVAEDGWAPITDAWEAPNGVSLVPLTDPRELAEEGRELHHCVGGYSEGCRLGRSHIVAVRYVYPDGTFKRLSTAEFGAISPETTKLTKRQHYGRGNGTANAEATEAVRWYMQQIETKRIPLNVDGVMKYMSGQRQSVEDVEAYCNYEWRDQAAIAQAFEPWKPYMPKRLRGIDVPGLQELPEVKALTDSISPTYSRSMSR